MGNLWLSCLDQQCQIVTKPKPHNIIQSHNNVMWSWIYSIEYFLIFSTLGLNVGYFVENC